MLLPFFEVTIIVAFYIIADYAGEDQHMAHNHGARVRVSYLQLFVCLI